MKKYSVFLSGNEDGSTFNAVNSDGYELTLNGLSSDDTGKGISPMEMLLAASGGCAAIDVVCLLKQEDIFLENIDVRVNGSRNMRESPAYFREVEIHFIAKGNISVSKISSIILLSLEKYCTVGKTLEAFADISWSLNLNGVQEELQLLSKHETIKS